MIKHIVIVVLVLVGVACTSTPEPIIVYCIGDSTMANKSDKAYPETGWCQVLQDYMDETVTVSNHSRNGRSSKSFIGEGLWQVVYDSLNAGDVVFIQFGHNDQKHKSPDRYTLPFEEYSDNLRKYINETREKGATPILFTSIIRRKFGEDGKLIDTHGDYPVATRMVAKEMNVPCIDMQQITEKWVNEMGDEASKKMYLWYEPSEKHPKGKKDDTHLCVEGANEIAKLALAEIKRQELDLAMRTK